MNVSQLKEGVKFIMRVKKVEYLVKIKAKDELVEKVRQFEAKFEIKDNEAKEYLSITMVERGQRLYMKVTYKKRTKKKAKRFKIGRRVLLIKLLKRRFESPQSDRS